MSDPKPNTDPKQLGVKPATPAAPIPDTDLRDIDPRQAATERAEKLREHWGGEQPDGADEFYIDPRIIPDGWGYEWRTLTVLNAPNPSYQVHIAQAGWEPVPTYRHPEMMPEGHPGGAQIIRQGQGLFERPAVIIDAAKRRELKTARAQVKQKEEQLTGTPAGTMERRAIPGKPVISKSYEAIPIPK